MARDYGLTIESPDGTVASFLQSASSARINYALNAVSTLDLSFDSASSDAQTLYTLLETTIPVVRLARDGYTVFTGPLTGLDMTVTDSGDISASFSDWVGMLAAWSPYGTYKNATANTIVSGLLGLARWPSGFSGLTRSGSVTSTATVSRAEQSNCFEQLTQAAAVAPFDWYVSGSTMTMDNTLGTDKSANVRFGVGDVPGASTVANGQSARVTYQPPKNVVWATSAKGKVYSSTGSASVSAYGQHWEQVDAANSNAQAFADAERRDKPRQIVEIDVDPQLAPAWLTDYYLGDTVSVGVSSKALSLTKNLRVNAIGVDLNESMVETSNSLTFEVV